MKRESQLDDGPGKFLVLWFLGCIAAFWPFTLSGGGRIAAVILWYGSIAIIVTLVLATRNADGKEAAPPPVIMPPSRPRQPDLRESDVFEGIR